MEFVFIAKIGIQKNGVFSSGYVLGRWVKLPPIFKKQILDFLIHIKPLNLKTWKTNYRFPY